MLFFDTYLTGRAFKCHDAQLLSGLQAQWQELKLLTEQLQARSAELEMGTAAQHAAEQEARKAAAATAKLKAGMRPTSDCILCMLSSRASSCSCSSCHAEDSWKVSFCPCPEVGIVCLPLAGPSRTSTTKAAAICIPDEWFTMHSERRHHQPSDVP